ncbi:hypothetical protein [Chitinophaga solisilvae]|uniref:Uncharacterized protein n=1 Tax=Chitinophaga solisilvae TaxID=1233460 RepID=A0A433WEV2_9BACT|nr:hypothetical protein [Chitinophaga solisilvae]NSL89601.1 hypothetical protein [Chitinophaga solisilvae]
MELKFYIESGIIESYVLGLATEAETEELQHMRKLYPELDTEVDLVERRLEKAAFDEAVLPPMEVKDRILQRARWEYAGAGYGDSSSNYTFINIQPKDGSHISVHRWWKIFFIIIFILSKIFLFFAIFYYLKYRQQKEKEEPKQVTAIYVQVQQKNSHQL